MDSTLASTGSILSSMRVKWRVCRVYQVAVIQLRNLIASLRKTWPWQELTSYTVITRATLFSSLRLISTIVLNAICIFVIFIFLVIVVVAAIKDAEALDFSAASATASAPTKS